jgi:hypothetical protein
MAKVVNDEQRDFTDKEKPEWEKCNADYNALTRQIEIAERAEGRRGRAARRDEAERKQARPPGPRHPQGE